MEPTEEIDAPELKKTPAGWLAMAVDSPKIAVTAETEDDALALFRVRRAAWRQLLHQAGQDHGEHEADREARSAASPAASGHSSPNSPSH